MFHDCHVDIFNLWTPGIYTSYAMCKILYNKTHTSGLYLISFTFIGRYNIMYYFSHNIVTYSFHRLFLSKNVGLVTAGDQHVYVR